MRRGACVRPLAPALLGAMLYPCLPLAAQVPGEGVSHASVVNGMPRPNPAVRAERRAIFITGQVFIEDGGSVSSPIAILGGCRGSLQMLGYTDMRGHFAIDVKPGNTVEDATSKEARGSAVCEVAARLEGYRSSTVDLSRQGELDHPDVGTILLHRIGDQEGSTVSLTSLKAPGGARRAFEKGMGDLHKRRLDDAAKQFHRAVTLYPQYADAWYRLGHVQGQKGDNAAARASFTKAIAADPKLVPPYVELAALNVNEGRWQEAVDYAQRAIRLDPFGAPMVYFFDALANYNLKNWTATEKSARQLQRLDTQHRYIKINRILGALLVARHDYAGAAEQMREYLQFSGDAKDAGEVRAQLAELDKRLAAERN